MGAKPRIEIVGWHASRTRAVFDSLARCGYESIVLEKGASGTPPDFGRPGVRIEVGDADLLAIASCRLKHANIDTAVRLRPLLDSLAQVCGDRGPPRHAGADALIGDCAQMRRLRDYLAQIAQVDSTVLVTGETGTGKQLVAETIHRLSARRDGPFVSVNCAAIPDTLLESELFGHERGAFTGAFVARPGKLELADAGTFFLDEIGDMNPLAQAKLLRVLESGEVERLGARQARTFDVRFIAATNQDLEKLVERGAFRKDLYYRLNVARVALPPLRERAADVPLLLSHYADRLNRSGDAAAVKFSDEALACLAAYTWPGNVRELRNFIEAAIVSRPAKAIAVTDLPKPLRTAHARARVQPSEERQQLLSALSSTNWNVSKAAQSLHWSRMTLYRKMAKHRIYRPPDTQPLPATT